MHPSDVDDHLPIARSRLIISFRSANHRKPPAFSVSWYPTLGSPLTLPDLLLNVILGRRVNFLAILDHDMLLGYYWRRLQGRMPVFCVILSKKGRVVWIGIC